MQLVGMVLVMMGISATILLMPLLLQFPDFDLIVTRDNNFYNATTNVTTYATAVDKQATLKAVANAAGVLAVPNGIIQLLTSTVFFLLLSRRIGDMPTMRIGSVLMSASLAVYGIGCSKFWHLLVVHGVNGLGGGLTLPAIGPKTAAYCKLAHSKNVARATAMSSLGMSLGFMAGPPLMMGLAGDGTDRDKINIAFVVAGVLFALGAVVINMTIFFMMRHPAVMATKRTPEQIEAAWKTSAMNESQFIDEMCDQLRGMLTKDSPQDRNWSVFHGHVQRMIRRSINDFLPLLPDHDKENHSKDRYEAMWNWIQKNGTHEEQENFYKFALTNGITTHLGMPEVSSAPELLAINEPVSETISREVSSTSLAKGKS